MGWVDTHCHLQLDDRPAGALLDEAVDVDWVLVPGVDGSSSEAALRLASAHPNRVVAGVGLHPHEAEKWSEQSETIVRLASEAAAVGETGLDYYRNLSSPGSQRAAFVAHIELASTLGKPLIVHCRDAFADVFELIEESGVGPLTVLHCWTGGPRWTRRFLDLGVTFSFAGPITYPTGHTIRLAAAEVPPGRAVIETDTPYLTPMPHRGRPNRPAWVPLVGEALAEVWGMKPAEVADSTSKRAVEVFGGPGDSP